MSTLETKITTDRECDHCGYNLKGLPIIGKCPECGTPIRRLSTRITGSITDEAPTRFVRVLRLGFAFTSLAIIAAVLARIVSEHAPLIDIPASLIWVAGIWLITSKRRITPGMRRDTVLDNDRLRKVIRLLNATWPLAALSGAGIHMLKLAGNAPGNTGGGTVLLTAFTVLRMAMAVVAWLCMIPTSIYVGELAYWASHDSLANRMRGTAWILAVIGSITALLTGIGLLTASPVIPLLLVLPLILLFGSVVVYNFAFLQMTSVMHWVIKHQVLAAGSFERLEQRRKRQEARHARILNDTPCDHCGYNLIGIESGQSCPQCGTLISTTDVPLIRDPAQMPGYHDNSPIELHGDDEHNALLINDQHDEQGKPIGIPYTPEIEVPDEGDIPLSHDEDVKPIVHEQPPKLQQKDTQPSDPI